jgi:hypothetical protein
MEGFCFLEQRLKTPRQIQGALLYNSTHRKPKGFKKSIRLFHKKSRLGKTRSGFWILIRNWR